MNKYILKSTLTAAGVLAVIGTVGAQAYTSHEQTGQVAAATRSTVRDLD